VLSDEGYGTPQEVVIDENGAMAEWKFARGNRMNSKKNYSSVVLFNFRRKKWAFGFPCQFLFQRLLYIH
jgi:hypothetical protein